MERRIRKPPTEHVPNLKITFKQIFEVLFQCFWKALEKHWDNLFERNFADLRQVFAH